FRSRPQPAAAVPNVCPVDDLHTLRGLLARSRWRFLKRVARPPLAPTPGAVGVPWSKPLARPSAANVSTGPVLRNCRPTERNVVSLGVAMPVLAAEPNVYPATLLETTESTDADQQWWVLHCRPRQEKALARRLLDSQI